MNILFVCTGNTCRSPMAEAVFRHYANDSFQVKSAGVFAAEGCDASLHAKQALEDKGIAIDHSAQPVTKELLNWADIVLAMTQSHKLSILQYYPYMKDKVLTLYEATGDERRDISDPYGGSLQVYKNTLDELEMLIQRFIEKLENERSED